MNAGAAYRDTATRAAKEREDALSAQLTSAQGQLQTAWGELTAAGESVSELTTRLDSTTRDLVERTRQLEDSSLQRSQEETVLRCAISDARETLLILGFPAAELEGLDGPSPAAALAKLMEQLRGLPQAVAEKIQEEAHEIAGAVGSTLLPRVASLSPGFPFDQLFESFETEEDHAKAALQANPAVENLKRRFGRTPR